MNRSKALPLLAQHKARLAEQFGVTRLVLFGSTVRDAAREDSDVQGACPAQSSGVPTIRLDGVLCHSAFGAMPCGDFVPREPNTAINRRLGLENIGM